MKKVYLLIFVASLLLFKTAFSQCNVVAGFNTTYVNNQLNVVQCLNTSRVDSNSVVYSVWNFGDGTPSVNTSGLSQPTHTYTASGLYNICLQVISVVPGSTTINCADTICRQVQVQAPTTCALVASFTTTQSSNVVALQNTSTGYAAGDSVCWTFGDGTVAYSLNTTHTYTNSGTYTVCLRIKKNTPVGSAPCVSEICQSVTISNTNPCSIYPNFTAAPSPNTNNVYVFTNTTSPASSPASVTWNFGDSTYGSGNVVTHTYAQSGVYRVCMTVVLNNTCSRDTCITLIVNNPVPPACSISPRFSVIASQSQPGLFVFNNTSIATVAMSVVWSFGDSTAGTGNSVSHTYTHSGVYNVCMRVSTNNNSCVRDTCGTIVVNIPTPQPCSVVAGFNTTYVNNQLNVVQCLNTSRVDSNSVVYSVWNFGDGTPSVNTSGLSQPTHTYTASGLYNICLKVISVVPGSTTVNCADSICRSVQVQASTTCTLVPNFNITRSTANNNTFEFSNTTTGMSGNAVVLWNFGDGTTATGNLVQHAYSQLGNYNVCMDIVDSLCTRRTCRYVSPANYLQSYPNPVQSNVNVNINLSQSTPISAYVYNSQGMLVGQLLQQGMQGNNLLTFNVAALPSGYYTIRIYTANGVFISRFQKL